MVPDLFIAPRVTRTATEAELDVAEAALGWLPPTYRSFASQYGAGLTNGLLIIAMPFDGPAGHLVKEHARWRDRLEAHVSAYLEDGAILGDADCLEAYDPESAEVAARYRELGFFARSENGESLAWLRTGDDTHFFLFDRAFFSVRSGGTDLLALVRTLQTDRVKSVLGQGYRPLPRTFVGYP